MQETRATPEPLWDLVEESLDEAEFLWRRWDRALSSHNLYNYPGGFFVNSEGQDQVRVRLEEHQADFEVFEGAGDVRGIGCGYLFTLADHPRNDQNAEYLVVSSWYDVSISGYESSAVETSYRCSFGALPSKRQFRTAETTPKPRVEGPQTAIVAGPAGEKIWTDKYGRVKVQFHWDREGASDEKSSCWVRVAQVWAGTNWGRDACPADRTGGHRRLSRGRPRPADHHRARLQRQQHAPLRFARQSDAERHQESEH